MLPALKELIVYLKKRDVGKYIYTITITEDGYIGFYLSEDSKHTFTVQNLQVELGKVNTEYEDYIYNLIATLQTEFTDEKYVTYDEKVTYLDISTINSITGIINFFLQSFDKDSIFFKDAVNDFLGSIHYGD